MPPHCSHLSLRFSHIYRVPGQKHSAPFIFHSFFIIHSLSKCSCERRHHYGPNMSMSSASLLSGGFKSVRLVQEERKWKKKVTRKEWCTSNKWMLILYYPSWAPRYRWFSILVLFLTSDRCLSVLLLVLSDRGWSFFCFKQSICMFACKYSIVRFYRLSISGWVVGVFAWPTMMLYKEPFHMQAWTLTFGV